MTHPRNPSVTGSGKMSDNNVVGTTICPTCNLQLSSTTKYCPNDSTPLNNNDQERAILNYQILRLLGSGGMGDVYEAEHVVLKQRVAIKTLKSHLIETSAFMRFQSEALAAGQLKHPNIVRVHDCGLSANGEPYMIMEMVTGANLGQLIASSGTLNLEDTLDIISQICKAIDFAHQKGILHRDLKPSNIMLEVEGATVTARILDFGIAKILSEDPKPNLTRTGELLGTPSYMSPEQSQGQDVDQRSDIYSIGCILFEMLTGQPPFLGRSAMDVMMKHISETPLSLSQAGLKPFPPGIESLVARALEKDPAARFPTAREMDTAIRNYRKGIAEPLLGEKQSEPRPRVFSKVMIISLLSAGGVCAIVIGLIVWSLSPEGKTTSVEAAKRSTEDKLNVSSSTNAVSHSTMPTLAEQSEEAERKNHASDADNEAFASVLLRSQNERRIDVPFDFSDITDRGLENLRYCHQLTELHINGCSSIKGYGLAVLKNCPQLNYLDLRDCRGLTLEGLSSIFGLPLVRLELAGTTLGDDGANVAKKLHVEYLDLSHANITDRSPLSLESDLDLKTVLLKGTGITDVGVRSLSKLSNLKTLQLDSCALVSDAGVAWLANSKIESLSLNDCAISDRGCLSLSHMQHLQKFYLKGTRIDDGGAQALGKLKNLKLLTLDGCLKISDEGIEWLSNSKLEYLSLNDCAISGKSVPSLLHMQSLSILKLRGTQIDATGLRMLAAKEGLTLLDVSGCRLLHREDVNAVRQKTRCKIVF